MQPDYVEFTAPDGDTVRFTEGNGVILEEIFSASSNRWVRKGEARRINYDPATRQVTDHNGNGGVIPQKEDAGWIAEKLAGICSNSGVPHNIEIVKIKKHAPYVRFEAPSGDHVKLTATATGVKQQLLTPKGWKNIGRATTFHYNQSSRALVNQDGLGGVLPKTDLTDLLRKIASVCDLSNTQHNIVLPKISAAPAPAPAPRQSQCSKKTEKRLSKQQKRLPITLPEADTRNKILIIAKPGTGGAAERACKSVFHFVNQMSCEVRKITKVTTRTTIELGLEWVCDGILTGDTITIFILGSTDTYLASVDWHYHLSKAPRGCKVTIISDGASNLLQLPTCASATPKRGSIKVKKWTSSPIVHRKYQLRCSASQILIIPGMGGGYEVGFFMESFLRIVSSTSATVSDLLEMCGRVVQARRVSGFSIEYSSTKNADIHKDVFTMGEQPTNTPTATFSDSIESFSMPSSASDDDLFRVDLDEEALASLYRKYSRK
eukprot:TRINITY_DN3178_c0_g1_i1.p1 TRINITY_DN3178_c0_g1~~TRINITY_DN3178_c0_g1_i1.p1  ORF type:complete len:491 (+),score=85.78 TRINITY_DN3178_c0_g1_i1:31-1503(+)